MVIIWSLAGLSVIYAFAVYLKLMHVPMCNFISDNNEWISTKYGVVGSEVNVLGEM
jgi:hypothetical protein